jgi:hypothetical protein
MSKSKKIVAPQIINKIGVFKYNDGSVYEGEYADNITESTRVREGTGKFITKTSTYEGLWVNDSMHGLGKLTFIRDKGVDIYIGDFKNNQFDGIGSYTFANQSVYEGEWKENRLHGKGKYTDIFRVDWGGSYLDGRYDSLLEKDEHSNEVIINN